MCAQRAINAQSLNLTQVASPYVALLALWRTAAGMPMSNPQRLA